MRTQPQWMRAYRLFFALLGLAAVGYQCWYSTTVRAFPIANFFSFFTIQSNLFAAAVLLWGAIGDSGERSPRTTDLIRGAATLYLSITGVVYGVLLAGYQEELQTTIPWVDTALHRVIPLVMVLDWLIDPPHQLIAFRRALVWLIYPLLYALYSLVRGPFVNWYPYPFLDHRLVGGYGVVALYCIGITLTGLLFTWLVVLAGRRVRLVATPA